MNYSSIDIINPPQNSNGFYTYDSVDGYGPDSVDWSYTNPDNPKNFYSPILSSAQRLPNGNTLICSGSLGYFFEIDSNNNIVWEYINPDTSNGILTQGDLPSANSVFRAIKLPLDYPALINKNLSPGRTIEQGLSQQTCNILGIKSFDFSSLIISPNPATEIVNLNFSGSITKVNVYDIFGKPILSVVKKNKINIEQLSNGIYILKIFTSDNSIIKKIIKH